MTTSQYKYRGIVVDRLEGTRIYQTRWLLTVESASHRAEKNAPKGDRYAVRVVDDDGNIL